MDMAFIKLAEECLKHGMSKPNIIKKSIGNYTAHTKTRLKYHFEMLMPLLNDTEQQYTLIKSKNYKKW